MRSLLARRGWEGEEGRRLRLGNRLGVQARLRCVRGSAMLAFWEGSERSGDRAGIVGGIASQHPKRTLQAPNMPARQ